MRIKPEGIKWGLSSIFLFYAPFRTFYFSKKAPNFQLSRVVWFLNSITTFHNIRKIMFFVITEAFIHFHLLEILFDTIPILLK